MRTATLRALIIAALVAACGGAVPAPTPQPPPVVTSRPTVAPPTAPPPTATPIVTPVPAPTGTAAEVIDSFFTEFAEADKPFHVESRIDFTGASGTQTESGSVEVNGDIDGQNFDGEVILPGERVVVRFVDGVFYGKQPGGTWITLPDFKQTQPLNPFGLLERGDVSYVGSSERNGRTVHELRFTKWIGGELEAEGISRIELLSHDFKVFVSERGIPVEAILDFSISGYVAGFARPVQLDYHVVYLFSEVGKPIEIRAPI